METYLENLVCNLKNMAHDDLEKVEKQNNRLQTYLIGILSQAANVKTKQVELNKELKDGFSSSTADTLPVSASASQYRAEQLLVDKPVVAQNPAVEPIPSTPGQPDYNPTPDVTPPQPEIPDPKTPVPSPTGPEIERPMPDIPDTPSPAPEIERPVPEIGPITPGTPEIQPPLTQPGGPTFGQPLPAPKLVA